MTASPAAPPPADVTMLLGDRQWHPVDPANPGSPVITALWGDPATGPYGALMRVPAGFESPPHRHSSDERVIVISGSSVHWVDGESRETATVLRAGDFMLMPAGLTTSARRPAMMTTAWSSLPWTANSTSNWPRP